MDDFLRYLIEQFPTLMGLLLLSFVLYRQNNKLLADLLERIEYLERQVNDVRLQLVARKYIIPEE